MIERSKRYQYDKKSWLLSCNTKYPIPLTETNISNMKFIRKFFDGPVSHSDHSGNKNSLLAATILGAQALEFHIAWDREQFVPDSNYSILVSELNDLINDIDDFERIKSTLYDEFIEISENKNNKVRFGKSLLVKNIINPNQAISIDNLESTKHSNKGIDTSEYKSIIGKFLRNN